MTLDADRSTLAKLFIWTGRIFIVVSTGVMVVLTVAGLVLHKPRPSLWPPGWRCAYSGRGGGICVRDTGPPRMEPLR